MLKAHRWMKMTTTKLFIIVAVLMFGQPLFCLASETRAGRLREERLKKALSLKPPERSGLERTLFKIKEDRIIERYQAGFKGFHPLIGGMSTGSGWALGALYRKDDLFNGALVFSASAQISAARYKKYEAAVVLPQLADQVFLGFRFTKRDFPQEEFFGIGSNSREENRSNYRLEDTDYSATLGVRPTRYLQIGPRVGFLDTKAASGTDRRFPSVERVFDAASVAGLERQPDYLYFGGFATYDNRDEPFNPRSGGLYRVEGLYYDDRDFSHFSFRRWDMEVQRYFPFFNDRRVIAARARLQLSDTKPGQQVPFYLMPTLGGSEDLRGFRELRFRDQNALVFNLEYRWEAFSGMDLALFGDAGNVYGDRKDITLRDLQTAYGVGVRFNTS